LSDFHNVVWLVGRCARQAVALLQFCRIENEFPKLQLKSGGKFWIASDFSGFLTGRPIRADFGAP